MESYLTLTPHDPLIARDGRPFGAGHGNRMRGLPWPLPSVVAGSFRTALVKAGTGDFTGKVPERLMQIAVAGVFPSVGKELYLPAPNDCVWDEKTDTVHRVQPVPLGPEDGVDFEDIGLRPVCLTRDQADDEFKAKTTPAWWPASKYAEWLTSKALKYEPTLFAEGFLHTAIQSMRDHVALDADRGAAAESELFATANLNVTHLPRFGAKLDDKTIPLLQRFAEVKLSARVTISDSESQWKLDPSFDIWHPLGGERRLVHWKAAASELWKCPVPIRNDLQNTTTVRMVLATPAIFRAGWKPDLAEGPLKNFNLKLVGISNGRWKAVSGWSLADTNDQPRGPKPIRRMVPAGSVYFFKCKQGAAAPLANRWLESVSDEEQSQRDGFGLAIWGTW